MKKEYTIFLPILFVLLLISSQIQLIGINTPLTGEHGFRQTQTAISVYYMLKDGYSIFYETPVFGYPWKIPFEFPVYQSVVWLFAKLLHIGLNVNKIALIGRFVSISFYYGTLFLLYLILKELKFDLKKILLIFIIVTLSPVYLFWTKAFLVESTALFFCVGFIFFSLRFLNTNKSIYIVYALLFSIIGCLAKLTTFIPSATITFMLMLFHYRLNFLSQRNIIFYILLILSVIPTVLYTHFADLYKLQNPLSIPITSANLSKWNFGSLDQRLSFDTYKQIYEWSKANLGLLITPCLITWILNLEKRSIIQFSFLLAYLSSILIFLNLFYVHHYYYYANSLFGLIFIALEINELIKNESTIKVVLLIIIAGIIQLYSYYRYYYSVADTFKNDIIQSGQFIKEHTDKGKFVVICNTDWSSEIPFYSERRSIIIQGYNQAVLEQVISNSGGKQNIGMVVITKSDNKNCNQILDTFTQIMHKKTIESGITYLY